MAKVEAERALDMSLDDVIDATSGRGRGRGRGKGKGRGDAPAKSKPAASSEKAKPAAASEKAAIALDMTLDEVIESSKGGGKSRKKGAKGEEKGERKEWKGDDKGDGKGKWKGKGKDDSGGSKGKGKGKDDSRGNDGWGKSGSSSGKGSDWGRGGKGSDWGSGGGAKDSWDSWKKPVGGSGKDWNSSWKPTGSSDWESKKSGGKDSWGGGKEDSWGSGKGAGRGKEDSWGKKDTSWDYKSGDGGGSKWYQEEKDMSRWSSKAAAPDRNGGWSSGASRKRGIDDRWEAADAGHGRGGGSRPGGAVGGSSGVWTSTVKRGRFDDGPSERDRSEKSVKVTNIPTDLDWRDIKGAFENEAGKILRCEMEKGTAWITFEKASDARKAVDTFDRGELNGRTIEVTIVR
mmetsp:Transcript_34775/g.75578  ORF Transcript_34775/g.75578 Transcript_34775/m.75578 type:complete len:402 (-) Transcript_34775:9-1214(-)